MLISSQIKLGLRQDPSRSCPDKATAIGQWIGATHLVNPIAQPTLTSLITPDSRHHICGRVLAVICLRIWRIADKKGRYLLRISIALQGLLDRRTTICHPICATTPGDHHHHALIDICRHISKAVRTMTEALGLIGGLVVTENRMLTEHSLILVVHECNLSRKDLSPAESLPATQLPDPPQKPKQ